MSVGRKGQTGLDGDACIVHVAANVGENLGLEAELADGLAIIARLLGGGGGGEFDVLYTKGIECLGDGDLCLGVEKGIGELFALWESMSGIIGLFGFCGATRKRRKTGKEREKKVCNGPLRVLSMILKFEMLFKKSEARGA